ncbi:MarR family transcriptional regulator [Halobacillus litoralis]|uniref:MarR family winged helix-turn-helix transcriptional regulator n=1 Tax=Halobacillus litoralis TaxID=45668 RepID=UPI001CD676D2|nr:winged helix DNA-binding protein [Halobacillus litoralis]MCA0972486.1 MarR family transcriptional regulator [Halobacillus litoralis]
MKYEEAEKFRYLILAAQRQGNRLLNEKLRGVALTSSQAEVIQVLKTYQPITLKELGSLLVCETGSPSRLMNRLIEEGVIERVPNQEDKRSSFLQLTNEGEKLSESIQSLEDELYEGFMSVLSEEEMKQVNHAVGKLMVSISDPIALEKRNLL